MKNSNHTVRKAILPIIIILIVCIIHLCQYPASSYTIYPGQSLTLKKPFIGQGYWDIENLMTIQPEYFKHGDLVVYGLIPGTTKIQVRSKDNEITEYIIKVLGVEDE